TWTTSHVFGNAAQPGLGDYCLYEYTGKGPPDSQKFQAAITNVGGSVEEDCVVVGPLDDAEQGIRNYLRDQFNIAVDRLAPLPSGPPDAGIQPSPILIAVPDTEPEPDLDAGTFAPNGPPWHGRVMRGIIQDLTCTTDAGGACPGVILPELALPHITNNDTD